MRAKDTCWPNATMQHCQQNGYTKIDSFSMSSLLINCFFRSIFFASLRTIYYAKSFERSLSEYQMAGKLCVAKLSDNCKSLCIRVFPIS